MKTRLPRLLAALVLGFSAHAADTTFTYDAAGRLIATDLGDGAFITYAYDANGNLLASRHAPTNAAPAPADLAVSIAYPDGPAPAGAPFRCVVTVTNAGPGLARDTRLTNSLPAGAVVIGTTTTQGFVTSVNGLVALDLGALAPAAAVVVELTLQIPAPGPPPLVATVGSPNDATPGDNTASAAPTITAAVNLSLTGHAGPSPLTLGSRLRHEFMARNTAATLAAGVVLTSRFSAAAAFIAATSSAGTITTNAGEVIFDLGALAPGATATASLTVAPALPGVFTNLATLAASGPELTPEDNALELGTPTQTPTLFVVNTNDAGPGSLRQALLDANAAPDRDIIAFAVPDTGGFVPTIAVVTSNLPVVTQPVVIDGFTQPEGMVELTGLGTRTLLTLCGGNSAVRGLALNRSAVFGLLIETNGNNVVEGCRIGCAPDGLTGRPNQGSGISINNLAFHNRIGGPEPWQRNLLGTNFTAGINLNLSGGNRIEGNYIGLGADGSTRLGNVQHGIALAESAGDVIVGNVISGNGQFGADGINVTLSAGDTLIVGNRIGTDASGTVARPNLSSGINVSSAYGVTIGDGTPEGRNVIAGNLFRGITLGVATGVRIAGNYIGTDATGTQRLPNVGAGVFVGGASGTVIGGAQSGEGNVISGNTSHGLDLPSTTHSNLIQGNLIGLDASGALVLSNGSAGVNLGGSRANLIGGSTPGAGNVISGNLGNGVALGATAHFNVIQGNFIGTDATGMLIRSNNLNGVSIAGGSTNRVGGLAPGEGNLISGNGFDGVSISSSTPVANRIEGNWLGVDRTGAGRLGNRLGVSTFNNARETRIVGNVISGNRSSGMQLTHVSGPGAVVMGNFIGTDATGLLAVSNTNPGILISRSPNNTIGPGNVIGGNGRSGIEIARTNAFNNVVVGNRIGVGADGVTPVPNQLNGVTFFGAATNRLGGASPGDGNEIAFNAAHGVQVRLDATDPAAAFAFANAILGNAIHDNAGLGIELGGAVEGVGDGSTLNDAGDADDGPNRLQNFPMLAALTAGSLGGSLTSAPSATFRVEVFASAAGDSSGFGEGAVPVTAFDMTTDPGGVAVFSVPLAALPAGATVLTATATDALGNTSEFGPALMVGGPPPPPLLGGITILPGGQFQFQFAAQPGASYTVEASTNLLDWLPLFTTNAPGPLLVLPDGNVSEFPARYFRVRSP